MEAEQIQLVILRINDGLYAIASEHFHEVIKSAVATPVPFVPPYIEGLVNIEGRIATQIDFGRFVSGNETASQGHELALIHTGRSLCALRVEQVVAIIDFKPESIEKFGAETRDEGNRQCVSGELVHEGQNILLLDPVAIGLLVQSRQEEVGRGGLAGRVRVSDENITGSNEHYLIVRSGGERFGFPIARITELVKTDHCTQVPGVPAIISGLALVRGQPVLAANLSALLDASLAVVNKQTPWMILVEKDDLFVGLQVDEIDGIEACELSTIIKVNHPGSTIMGVVNSSDGEMTMLVDINNLFSEASAISLRRFMPSRREDKNAKNDDAESRACLSVLIGNELFAIPLEVVSRVIEYRAMESVHDENDRILGAIDVDGRVVPVINMHKQAGRSSTWSEYIIVENRKSEYAIRVNETHRVIDMPVKNISRSKNTINPFIAAVAQYEQSIYSMFNSEHLVNLQTI